MSRQSALKTDFAKRLHKLGLTHAEYSRISGTPISTVKKRASGEVKNVPSEAFWALDLYEKLLADTKK